MAEFTFRLTQNVEYEATLTLKLDSDDASQAQAQAWDWLNTHPLTTMRGVDHRITVAKVTPIP